MEATTADRRRHRLITTHRAKLAAAELAGWLVLRFTWADLTHRSRATATKVRQALTR